MPRTRPANEAEDIRHGSAAPFLSARMSRAPFSFSPLAKTTAPDFVRDRWNEAEAAGKSRARIVSKGVQSGGAYKTTCRFPVSMDKTAALPCHPRRPAAENTPSMDATAPKSWTFLDATGRAATWTFWDVLPCRDGSALPTGHHASAEDILRRDPYAEPIGKERPAR